MNKIKRIGVELKSHAPFTIVGALTGIGMMLLFRNLPKEQVHTMFSVFHPAHVVLSAMATTCMFKLHRKARHFIVILIIGYVGSVGVATLSDCVIPFLGESLLGVAIPAHGSLHEHEKTNHDAMDDDNADHDAAGGHAADHDAGEHEIIDAGHDVGEHRPSLHLGFIEEWYLVNPAAILGILIAYFIPPGRYPHAAHVLISTWASSAHMLMNTHASLSATILTGMFIVLFVAVWLPCCVSDIIFPLLFVHSDLQGSGCMLCHGKGHDVGNDPGSDKQDGGQSGGQSGGQG